MLSGYQVLLHLLPCSLTGISSEKIDAAFASNAALDAAAEKVNSLQEEGDKLKEPVNNDTAVQFFKRAGNVTVNTIPYNITFVNLRVRAYLPSRHSKPFSERKLISSRKANCRKRSLQKCNKHALRSDG